MDERIDIAEQPQAETGIDNQRWYEDVGLEDAKAIIKANITTAARSFIAIGYYLKHIRDRKLFTEDGYATVWEFAQNEYGISMSTASRYMTMNDRFSRNGNSPVVDAKYQEFGKSQLQEMLALNDEQMEQVTSAMTVLDIRELGRPDKPKEIQVPGQIDISSFPEYMPGDFPEPELEPRSQEEHTFVMDLEDMLQGVEPEEEEESGRVLAISQQEEEWKPAELQELPEATEDVPDQSPEPALEENLEVIVCDMDAIENPPEKPEQPELPLLKNNDQRANFVNTYETWPLWIETEETGERYTGMTWRTVPA